MIKVDSITIKEFRGIRDLTLEFKGKNFAICGPNGTGKSGVVDALEFGLTGRVSRLSGEGKGEVSLKEHGPHVDSRNAPEKAEVVLTITIPGNDKAITLRRNLKAPNVRRDEGGDVSVRSVLDRAERHPEIVLSRRELIRYVLATPGHRADEVQALLQLDRVEKIRQLLQRISNASSRDVKALTGVEVEARKELLRALGITELQKVQVLQAANNRRAVLDLPALEVLEQNTSLADGLATQRPAQPRTIQKAQATADLKALGEAFDELASEELQRRIESAVGKMTALSADPGLLAGAARENLFSAGLALVESDVCPLCDLPWKIDDLKRHLGEKIKHLSQVKQKRVGIERELEPVCEALRRMKTVLTTVARHAALPKPSIAMAGVAEFLESTTAKLKAIGDFLPIGEAIAAVSAVNQVPQTVRESVAKLQEVVAALPAPSKQDSAREWLTIAQERLRAWRETKRRLEAGKYRAARAKVVFDVYSTTSDAVLTRLYETVEKDFARLYASIHRADEDAFSAKLTPSLGKLGFDVDFYGRGKFPPGAYHSEGHQDSMGLCLYLALMRHLHGAAFTFAVLDDVLMSVDSGHRREVCELLKREFPETQFVLTTHDPVWLRHMKTENLIGQQAAVLFRGWTVSEGPTPWADRDVWEDVRTRAEANDVRDAAALLRHYLEYLSQELCHRLRAPVEFRGDGQYTLGDLLPAAISRLRKFYRAGKQVSASWKQPDREKEIDEWEKAFSALATKSRAEEWQMNASVHFNSWENLTKEDFLPVVSAYKNLVDGFRCEKCRGFLTVAMSQTFQPEAVRCDCGEATINLKKKSASQ